MQTSNIVGADPQLNENIEPINIDNDETSSLIGAPIDEVSSNGNNSGFITESTNENQSSDLLIRLEGIEQSIKFMSDNHHTECLLQITLDYNEQAEEEKNSEHQVFIHSFVFKYLLNETDEGHHQNIDFHLKKFGQAKKIKVNGINTRSDFLEMIQKFEKESAENYNMANKNEQIRTIICINDNSCCQSKNNEKSMDKQQLNMKMLNNIFCCQILMMKNQLTADIYPFIQIVQCIQLDSENQIEDYYWKQSDQLTLQSFTECEFNTFEFNLKVLRTIQFYASLHLENFFHGNIQPDSIFHKGWKIDVHQSEKYLSTDCTSLVLLDASNTNLDNEIYIVNFFTAGFSSKNHIHAVKNQIPRSKRQLQQEDKHQLLITLKVLRIRMKRSEPQIDLSLLDYIIELLQNPNLSLIEVYYLMNSDTELFVKFYSDYFKDNQLCDEAVRVWRDNLFLGLFPEDIFKHAVFNEKDGYLKNFDHYKKKGGATKTELKQSERILLHKAFIFFVESKFSQNLVIFKRSILSEPFIQEMELPLLMRLLPTLSMSEFKSI